ncbi:MAG: exodeoxyribonuclease VII large subunit [Akkermansia sp.]|nr:exodeoxyribonuclease VII large subunit [Akkermansia sp.]
MVLNVSQLVAMLRQSVEQQVGYRQVIGEIGSCKPASSGHIYFTLKDSRAQLQCVLYRQQAYAARVRLQEGMLVELTGRATVWEGRGSLQFVVTAVRAAGQGDLQAKFEELKQRLAAEGLFSPERKKSIPAFPASVGLITSPTGAVIEDMRHRLSSRAPWMQAHLYPVQVQGKGAEYGLAEAIRRWNEPERYGLPTVDYLIIARGGGSLEDLWCFNEEVLARAIAASRLPIVSAVGHETDFTIADFVADLRAPTPTAAIELTTPDGAALHRRLQQLDSTLRNSLKRARQTAELRLQLISQGPLGNPLLTLARFAQRVDEQESALLTAARTKTTTAAARLGVLAARISPQTLRHRIAAARSTLSATEQQLTATARARLTSARAALQVHAANLAAASPQRALERGFALVHTPDGRLARTTADLPPGSTATLQLADGSRTVTVDT